MAIAVSGTATTNFLPSAGTSITCNVPSGISNGDVLIWVIGGNQNASIPTPASWNLVKMTNGVANDLGIFYRVASSEPASYTSGTLTSGQYSTIMIGYSGVDTGTPLDIASGSLPAMVAGTTAITYPAITPNTVNSWVIPVGKAHGASGVTFSFTNGNQDALDKTMTANNAGTANVALAVGHKAWTSGAYTATITLTGTATRTYGATFALRPAPSAAPVPYRMPYREAVHRSYWR